MHRNNESNKKEVVQGNKEGSPILKDEDVSEIWEVEIAKDALETIGDQDILLKGKAKEAMKEAVIENKSIIEMKPLEGEKKHKSMGEERTPLTNCMEKYSSLPLAYLDKVKWFKSLIPQLGSEVEETTPVEVKAASDIKSKETSSEPEEITIKDEIEIKQTKSKSTMASATIAKPLAAGQTRNTVLKAKDIEKEMFGKADPYVKMTLDNRKAKSATVKNNHNPGWNFEATFNSQDVKISSISISQKPSG